MKEQEAFSYSVSHDLRAPLRIIDYFSRVLDEDFGEKMNAETRSNLGRVRTAAKRMAMMIEDLLNLSRLSHGEIRVDNVDLSKMAREVTGELARQNPGRKVEVSIQDGLGARGDAGLLRIVLDNLLGNAWKYTGKKDVAHIAFSRVALGRNDAFLIEDNGNGFDMAHAENIFAPFQRFHSAAEFEGTGIGLATVQRIVNRHAGKIWVESDIATGTRVYWTLGAGSGSG
jgi:light-regulated signal transduction histidine kinase (bacteriophytochrome)